MKTAFSVATTCLAFVFCISQSSLDLSAAAFDEPSENKPHNRVDAHPIVSGFERFAEVEEITDAERGHLLINELNCSSCHGGESSWPVAAKTAPILTGIGGRNFAEHFETFLNDPHAAKPGTQMPDVLAGKPADEKKQIAESIAHFLASTGKAIPHSSTQGFINQGETLFHSIGCVACHDPQNADVKLSTSIPLGDLESKYTLPGLTEFISNPLHTRPSGRMPQFNFEGNEARSIASYLLRNSVVDSNLNYTYYEGKWERLPIFDQLKPVSSGVASGFDLTMGKNDRFGVVYQGFWSVPAEDKFTFEITSDDGARLIVNGATIVDHDGIHGMTTKQGKRKFKAGIQDVRVEYFENDGGEGLQILVSGGGLDKVGLESLLRATRDKAIEDTDSSFVVDLKKAAEGKKYFQSVGCANCHEMKIGGTELVSSFPSPPLMKELEFANGCLGESETAPAFGLSDHQKKALQAALAEIKNPKPGPVVATNELHKKLLTLNCYSCHSRESSDGLIRGGVVDKTGDSYEIFERKDWFTSTQVEMGDEGQHPPYLKSVGAKLKPKWLRNVLENGANERPYMLTRMPKFGKNNIGSLAEDLIKLDALNEPVEVVQAEDVRKVKAHGRFFAGGESLSCIKCHTFANYPATGIQALELTTMTKRLNKEWFHAYMLKPSRFRRGTRMPESWPGGKSFYPDILDGDTTKQIDALWQYLDDGPDAAKPKGLIQSKMELIPKEQPIVYRNFIDGAGARAIGVGYPEQTNIAFDAENCRLALIWQENFIDASRHWSGRGQGYEAPLGENVLTLVKGPAFVLPIVAEERWPERSDKISAETHFKGYRFDMNRRPIFQYEVGEIDVLDQPIPEVVDDRSLLVRKLSVSSSSTRSIWFRAATGNAISAEDGNVFAIDDTLKIKVTGSVNPFIRKGDRQELLIDIVLSDKPVEFELKYDW